LFAALLSAAPFHAALAQTAPNLGAAADFAVLGGTNVTCTAPGAVIGDVGVSPGSAVPFTNTGCTITGAMPPATNAAASDAQAALLTAYNSLVGQACTQTLSATLVPTPAPLAPGVYCFDAPGVAFTDKTLTLDGSTNPNGIWIFKVGAALAGSGFQMVMTNGAQPCNVYWVVGADAKLTTSTLPPLFQGNILAGAPTAAGGSITITGGSLIGRVLANTAVTMTGTSVIGCSSFEQPPTDNEDCENFCKNICKNQKNHDKDRDKYHCKDHEKDYCKDHYCMNHDKNRCKDHDNDRHDRW